MRNRGLTAAIVIWAGLGVGRAVGATTSPAPKTNKSDAAAALLSSDNWKVDDPHGSTSVTSFTTDEGTWISLDVDRAGKEIVFSLLGDLYLLPIEGGAARRITSGPAYDVQPRFSPDGQWIAFASDRDGLENLWVCDRSGGRCRQISKEKKSTVSQPCWSPDGELLVGRKRLTDISSLAMVELWIWSRRGGDGQQLTKKAEQADVADAAFSPDGRYIYYSARDGRFGYGKNPDSGIWQIKRYDRKTAEVIPLTAESGGAIAPLPAPDGRSLALIHRVRTKTELESMDLATGQIRAVVSGLSRDNQEGFAFHGTYPGYAYMPDGKSVVATADGKLFRFDLQSGARQAIPFSAEVQQTVSRAVRFEQRIGAETLDLRVLRWPILSPDGKTLIFSAAGHLYRQSWPSGAPSRLTDSSDFEYAPSFSPDGRGLVYVSWNDRDQGKVRWHDLASGRNRVLVDQPGQYLNPTISPDGSKVAYLAGSGAPLRGHDLAEELWLQVRWVPASGGESQYVTNTSNRGPNQGTARPQFNTDGTRLLYLEADEENAKPFAVPPATLVSIKLDGTDKHKLLSWHGAQEAVVSPDGKWVAYREDHNVYLTLLPGLDGTTIDVSADGGAFPVKQLTDEAGWWIAWSDSATLTWSLGPKISRLTVAAAFPDPNSAESAATQEPTPKTAKEGGAKSGTSKPDSASSGAAKSQLPQPEVVEVKLTVPRARPTGIVAYRHARLITMQADNVIEDGTIVVDKDRIVAIGPSSTTSIPSGAATVDLSGSTIIPGLIDEHAHLHYSTLDIFPQRPWKYLANLAYGVTTTHDPSASTQEVFGQSEMVEAGLIPGPRIFSTGYILYGADDPNGAKIKNLDDARHALRRLKALGAFSVKSYMQPRRDVRQWLIQAAREEQMMVVPEGGGDQEMDMTFLLDGHTTIEHALPITPLYKDVVTLLAKSQTSYTPTLLVAYGGLEGEKWFYQHYDVWKDEKLGRFVPRALIDAKARRRTMNSEDDWHHIDVAAGAKRVIDAGGTVCMGGHGQLQGLGPHWELWGLVQGGFTPLEALRAGTLAPARTLGLDRDLGSLESGKLADFVVLSKNPLERIENTDSVTLVVKSGEQYRPSELATQP